MIYLYIIYIYIRSAVCFIPNISPISSRINGKYIIIPLLFEGNDCFFF